MNTAVIPNPSDRDPAGKFQRGHRLGGRPRRPVPVVRCRRNLTLGLLRALGRDASGKFLPGHSPVSPGRPSGWAWGGGAKLRGRLMDARAAAAAADLRGDPVEQAEAAAAFELLKGEALAEPDAALLPAIAPGKAGEKA